VETAHAFGYRVVAPDISDDARATLLAGVGCELGQGALFEEHPEGGIVPVGPGTKPPHSLV
jgi:EAL domain-containing protein (putative c-di-GMP-specific phosphodiesterase class I)